MSYILEALKKSEQERARDSGALPDLKSVHSPSTIVESRSNTGWLFALILVVILASAGATYFYFASLKPGQESVGEVSTATQKQEAAPANQKTPDTVAQSRREKAEISMPVVSDPSPRQKPARQPQEKNRVIFSSEPLTRDDVIGNIDEQARQANIKTLGQDKESDKTNTATKGQQAVVQDPAMLISDIPDDVRRKIPRIAFEGHVYSSIPERRSVMINGHKMREGELVGDDLLIKEITPDGAEFEYRGYRFKLNALQDWSFN